ncbi:MAG TPA: hypothetical protein VFE36_05865 [Candidatus Baltobacteraceae bacterium]|nr:hypothetical protein [Candidatus Baltobacteraceae bacterium]
MMLTILGLLFALIPSAGSAAPTTSSSPSATPHELKTIVTVKSSPYCNALVDHFNGALVPMVANDRVFDSVDTQLVDMNEMFNYPDFVNRFVDLRIKVVKESETLERSLPAIRSEIDALHQASSLSSDPQAAKEMTDAASQLQEAYRHQFQLSTDLGSLARFMMSYNPMRAHPPLGGWTPYENTVPADEKNMKVVLHFDQQRLSIDSSENKAVDIATTAAEAHCSGASPSPSPKP